MQHEDGTEAGAAALVLRKKEFLERVVAASGAKRAVVREVADAVLRELGTALAQGESLILPPLGKVRVTKQLDRASGEVLQVKIRRGGEGAGKTPQDGTTDEPAAVGKKTAEDPLAEAGE